MGISLLAQTGGISPSINLSPSFFCIGFLDFGGCLVICKYKVNIKNYLI